MLILRIRHAETALADGRLDEAYQLVQADERLRTHRRGQDIVTRLVGAFHKRGQDHLAAARFAAALTDCEKAQQLAGDTPELLALRSDAMDKVASQRRSERLKSHAVSTAREHVENGHLAAGERILAGASVHDTRAGALLAEMGKRHDLVDSAVRNAGAALDRDDIDAALAEIETARANDRSDKRIGELCDRVRKLLRQRIGSAILDGRLDVADSLGQRLIRVDETSLESQQLLSAVAQCKLALDRIEKGRVQEAEEICHRLATMYPKAGWISQAVKHLAAAGDAVESLRKGPLGLLAVGAYDRDAPTRMPSVEASRGAAYQPVFGAMQAAGHGDHDKARHGLVARATGEVASGLPSKFVLQVDGAGSCLVVRQATVTIGPISSSMLPDVGLMAEPGAPVATIERAEEDYFLRGAVFAVNDRPAANKLLVSGDRIALTPRCRLGFLVPSAASTTAVIDLAGARFPRADVRRVILMDREVVIGAGSASHVRCDSTPDPIVLHARDNRLFVRAQAEVEVDGRPMDREKGIPLGAHVRVGLVSFVVTRA